jgi:hypothetical protein
MVAMDVAAANATEDPREGSARQKERKAASQTVRIGDLNLSSTLWKKCGYQGLLAQLNIYRAREGLRFRHHVQMRTSFWSWKSWRKVHNATRKS